MAEGFKLLVGVADSEGNVLEEVIIVVPANTIEQAAARVIDTLLEKHPEFKVSA